MTSFTDNPQILGNFNPYVKVLPTEDMVGVGLQLQSQFNEGVQKTQAYVNSIAGLPIAKSEVQNYVQQKLGQLREGVSKSLAGDFSDQRITNQIGGAARTISRDPIVRNGVQSTNRMQSALSQLEDAKKSGKGYGVENEWALQNSISGWLNDGKIDSPFSGSYTPYTNISKEFIDLYKEMHPGENVNQDAFRIGKDGNVEVNPTMIDGINPDKIQNVWNILTSRGDVQSQLAISGQYQYRGMDQNVMGHMLEKHTNDTLQSIQDQIQGLQIKMASDGKIDAKSVTQQIEQLKKRAEGIKSNYSSNLQQLITNPDGLKASLLSQDMANNFIGAYSYETLKANPLWESQMKVAQFELDQQKFSYQQQHDRDVLNWDKEKTAMEIQARLTAKGKRTDENGNPLPDDNIITGPGNISTEAGKLGSTTFDKLYNDSIDDLNQGMYGLVFSRMNNTDAGKDMLNPIKVVPGGGYGFNVDPSGRTGYKTQKEAHDVYQQLYSNFRTATMDATADTALLRDFQKVDPLIRRARFLGEEKRLLDTDRQELINETGKSIGNYDPDMMDAVIVNKQLPGWEHSLQRLKAKYETGPEDYQSWQHGIGIATGTGQGTRGGPRSAEFDKLAKAINSGIATKFQDLENKYKEKQMAYVPVVSTMVLGKDAEKEATRDLYTGILEQITSGEGDITYSNKSFREILGEKGSKVDEGKTFGAYYDPLDRKYYLTVKQGKAPVEKLEVSKEQFNKAGYSVQSDFWDKYGSDLALTNNTTTDVTRDGANTAYRMDRPASSKYDVRYHVVGNGRGEYSLKLYVSDRKTGELLLGGIDAGFNTSQSGIIDAVKLFSTNDVPIDALLATKSKK